MNKRMKVMLIGVAILFGSIFIYKLISALMLKRYLASQKAIVTVSTQHVDYSDWNPQIKVVGSVRAIRGVNVTTELAGMVKTIYFTPGAIVKEGTVLVQLNADAEIGQLHSLQAQAELAKITYRRDKKQYAVRAISKQTLDTDEQNLKNLRGQVAEQAATVAKKTIRAPFNGRLGINNVNPGQYLNVGDTIVMLQTLNPIYVDFYIPQQSLTRVKVGQPVEVSSDAFPDTIFSGKITTINPGIDTSTRNVEVEATLANPHYKLAPGMFATVDIQTGAPQRYLTLPQTAVTYNPYGNIVYVINESGKDKKNNPILTASQVFVTTGETRGDQVQVLSGLKEGDTFVTSGQLKLKNGSVVAINNSVVPTDQAHPQAPNRH